MIIEISLIWFTIAPFLSMVIHVLRWSDWDGSKQQALWIDVKSCMSKFYYVIKLEAGPDISLISIVNMPLSMSRHI